MKKLKKLNIILFCIAAVAFLLPFAIAVNNVFTGNFSFWYDPARDFLLAADNLHKITLIGPTSGIPGIFYGPYWIWLLSFGLLFSQDPRVVIFIADTLPYFVILTLILWKFRSMLGSLTVIILWLLFMLGTGMQYATSPWNPHPAPLLFSVLIYMIVFTDFIQKGRTKFIKTASIGLLCGLILNFHISFGLCVALGTLLFLLIYFGHIVWQKKKQKKYVVEYGLLLGIFLIGIVFAFVPFILFEVRHGFNQIQTAISVFSAKGSVVSVTGLSDITILQNFFGTLSNLLRIPFMYSTALLIVTVSVLIYQKKSKKVTFSQHDAKLFLLIATTIASILFLYLNSKNPVWEYHFIGVEILFLFLVGVIINKLKVLKIALALWLFITICIQMPSIISNFQNKNISGSNLVGKEQIIKTIYQDARTTPYTVYAYSPSIYVYEYTYLFKSLAQKDVPYDPSNNPTNAEIVYIIKPLVSDRKIEDFVNYRTPNDEYRTIKSWNLFNDTTIIKRIKVSKSL